MDNENQIRETFSKYVTVLSYRKRYKEQNSKKLSLELQNEELNKSLIGNEIDQKVIERQRNINNEKTYIKSLTEKYLETFLKIETFYNELNLEIPNLEFVPINNKEVLEFRDFVSNELTIVKEKLKGLIDSKNREELENKSHPAYALHLIQDKEYQEAKSRMEESKDSLLQIEKNRREIDSLKEDLQNLEENLKTNKGIEKKLYKLFRERYRLADKEFILIYKEAKKLSVSAEGGLEIKLTNAGDLTQIVNSFIDKVVLVRGRADRIKDFFDYIPKSSFKGIKYRLFRLWSVLFNCKNQVTSDFDFELEKLNIRNQHLTESDINKILESLKNTDLLELSLMLPEYKPNLFYYKNDKDKIDFSGASYGQQAGAILNILLNQTHGSLIIDQPEDDLDNKVIHQITERINETKENRQLIFSSHNANIAVNGDAELIIHLDHNADKSKGEIKTVGTIDSENTRKVIKDVMEGGEKAFQLRAKKYNFEYVLRSSVEFPDKSKENLQNPKTKHEVSASK